MFNLCFFNEVPKVATSNTKNPLKTKPTLKRIKDGKKIAMKKKIRYR
ncbi:Hypothetical protein I595_3244 [Croceitalea dokdonensis DOKDO 023]|uniref:Uncharacterized protein n=1 Tax=Croceitalea dokdonensis DOKDO 023 TaxID=1300341 RepID=A0A0P7A2N6_9FLAO|nr:Hypothetical protein I595_3244 [Croceitalea dokdonensis DOKDO 023]